MRTDLIWFGKSYVYCALPSELKCATIVDIASSYTAMSVWTTFGSLQWLINQNEKGENARH